MRWQPASGQELEQECRPGPALVAPVIVALNPVALKAVLGPEVGLALWPRRFCPQSGAEAAILAGGAAFSRVAEGTPGDVARDVLGSSAATAHLRADAARLAGMFADLLLASAVRLRLDHVTDDACRCMHVDAVGLRLLCTYAGRGTEWQDVTGTVRRMSPGHVGLFKGSAWPDESQRTPHRSPPVSHLPRGQRGRLLLVIDQIGYL